MSELQEDTFGWRHITLEVVARQVSAALGVPLELHDSSFRGGDYYRWDGTHGEELILQSNVLDADGIPDVEEFPDHSVLLYATELPTEWLEQLAAVPGAESLPSAASPPSTDPLPE